MVVFPPAVEVVAQCAGADQTEFVEFAHMVKPDCYIVHSYSLFLNSAAYTVSIKLRSTRLKMTTEQNRVESINKVLYANPPQSSEPHPMQLYLKVSNMGSTG